MASKAKHGDRSKAVEPGTETQEQGRLSASTCEDKIRRRAYELYVERGGEPGCGIEDWLQAGRELKADKSNAAGAYVRWPDRETSRARIVRIDEYGDPSVLKIEDIDVPPPASGEVQIDVKSIGLNRAEVCFVLT